MVTSTPLPVRASLRDLLSDLLGHPTTVTDAEPQELEADRPAVAAVYRRDDGTVAAVTISCASLAARSGAAIGMVPAGETGEDLNDDVLELFHEVVNVMAKLLNGPTVPHVVLSEVRRVPGKVAADVAELVTRPSARADYQVTVDGYGDGRITLLSG